MAIATAATEYLHDHLRAFTLFVTHYAELNETRREARARHVAAEEQGGELGFYHQVLSGPASRSYGIEVAQLAGMPRQVVERAKEVLASSQDHDKDA